MVRSLWVTCPKSAEVTKMLVTNILLVSKWFTKLSINIENYVLSLISYHSTKGLSSIIHNHIKTIMVSVELYSHVVLILHVLSMFHQFCATAILFIWIDIAHFVFIYLCFQSVIRVSTPLRNNMRFYRTIRLSRLFYSRSAFGPSDDIGIQGRRRGR